MEFQYILCAYPSSGDSESSAVAATVITLSQDLYQRLSYAAHVLRAINDIKCMSLRLDWEDMEFYDDDLPASLAEHPSFSLDDLENQFYQPLTAAGLAMLCEPLDITGHFIQVNRAYYSNSSREIWFFWCGWESDKYGSTEIESAGMSEVTLDELAATHGWEKPQWGNISLPKLISAATSRAG